jgi:hypothetical protein
MYSATSQDMYNRPGIKCENGHLEIAPQIIDRFSLVDKNFTQFFLTGQKIYYILSHDYDKLEIVSIVWRNIMNWNT